MFKKTLPIPFLIGFFIGLAISSFSNRANAVEIDIVIPVPTVDANGTAIPAGVLWGVTGAWTNVIDGTCWQTLPPLADSDPYTPERQAAEQTCYETSTPNNRTELGDWIDLITDGSPGSDATDRLTGQVVTQVGNGELIHTVDVEPLVERVYRVTWQYWNEDKTARKPVGARAWSTAILYAPDLVIELTQPGTVRIRVEPRQ